MGSELSVTPETKPEARMDNVAIFWIVYTILWSALLAWGMVFLYIKRDMPILRIRGLYLSFAGVMFLHGYWCCATLAYIYGPLLPATAEYWIMGIWLPFGIALFHASNMRFLYVANAQKKFVKKVDLGWVGKKPQIRKTLLARWTLLAYTKKVLILIGLGMGFQGFLTLFIFLVSKKFHDSFGIPGTEVTGAPMEKRSLQGRGWEWWPSIFWQLFWAWVVAPIVLWRSRHLRDTQGWRTQTIACCLSGLHAAPMWLIGIYVSGMDPVNNYFVPPMWIAITIQMLEIFTIFLPCWEVRKQRNLCQETLDSIARWESRQTSAFHSGKSVHSGTTSSSWAGRTKAGSVSTTGGSILTMEALELTLAKNPEPLQEFSALRDFSGENIAFLTRIRQWRADYIVQPKMSEKLSGKDDTTSQVLSRECFDCALRIYMDFISSNSAEFQVNLSSQDFKNLQSIFEEAARTIYGECNTPDPATPFDDTPRRPDGEVEVVRYVGEIPGAFSEGVFDDAEMSIKYLVLTNTWPKFIKERRSFDGASSVESAN